MVERTNQGNNTGLASVARQSKSEEAQGQHKDLGSIFGGFNIVQEKAAWKPGERGAITGYEFIQVETKALEGSVKSIEFIFGGKEKRMERHVNKNGDVGGFVENSAKAYPDTYIGKDALVLDRAEISHNARVDGNAMAFGDAKVSWNAQVFGDAQVYDKASVSGDARVYDKAIVSGYARVGGEAKVSGDASVTDHAEISDKGQVSDHGLVSGRAWVTGLARVSGDGEASGDTQLSYDVEINSGEVSIHQGFVNQWQINEYLKRIEGLKKKLSSRI